MTGYIQISVVAIGVGADNNDEPRRHKASTVQECWIWRKLSLNFLCVFPPFK